MSSHRTEEIEEAASSWLILRDSGKWTQDDQVRFEQWLNASTLHRVSFLRLEHAWEEAARLKALGAGIAQDRPPPIGRWNLSPFFDARQRSASHRAGRAATVPLMFRGRRIAVAACILLLLAGGSGAYRLADDGADQFSTPVGGIASVPLRDGSNITLNTDSKVRVALTGAERHIVLKQGEAFFEVAKDPGRPFVVEAGLKRVIAVGTKFSVQRSGEFVEIVVTEGKVRVEDAIRPPRHKAVADPAATRLQGAVDPVYLTAGAVAHAGEGGVLVERESAEEVEAHLSWRSGVLMFRDLPLADAVCEFNRYNVRKIVISDPAVGALKIEGNFRATNVDAFVRLLRDYFPVRVSMEGDRVTLSSR